jgi:hypothetical protein
LPACEHGACSKRVWPNPRCRPQRLTPQAVVMEPDLQQLAELQRGRVAQAAALVAATLAPLAYHWPTIGLQLAYHWPAFVPAQALFAHAFGPALPPPQHLAHAGAMRTAPGGGEDPSCVLVMTDDHLACLPASFRAFACLTPHLARGGTGGGGVGTSQLYSSPSGLGFRPCRARPSGTGPSEVSGSTNSRRAQRP